MPHGYRDRILRVDLTSRQTTVDRPGGAFYRQYMGGRALAAYYLLRETGPDTDPLSPDNLLVLAAGVLGGTPVAGASRSTVAARSPLTGGYGDGEAGGYWPAALKQAGWDAVCIRGRAQGPVYLLVTPEGGSLQSADDLWGRPTAEVEARLKQAHGDRARVCQTGPAGENLVRYACVCNDLVHFAGRSGMGAVMGSKNLRAVVVVPGRRGSDEGADGNGDENVGPTVADAAALKRQLQWLRDEGLESTRSLHEHGTAGIVAPLDRLGGLPTRNFRDGSFEGAERLDGKRLTETLLRGRGSCHACPIRCKRVVAAGEPYAIEACYGGPEYESIAALGSLCGVDDLAAVCKANERCAAYGLDTISTGVAVAFAMECGEAGLLTAADTGGIAPRFGDPAVLLELIEQIAARRGLGDALAEGVRRAADRIGPQAAEPAMHVRGQEIPMHEPRIKPGLGIGYMVSPTGADHCHNMHDTVFTKEGSSVEGARQLGALGPVPADDLGVDKVRLLVRYTNWTHFTNCALLCAFVPWSKPRVRDLVQAVTGWEVSLLELYQVGERAHNLSRLFTLRCGLGAAEERLPRRFFEAFATAPDGDGLDPGRVGEALRLYYEIAGWDAAGVPRWGKLAELGIEWAAPEGA